MPFLSRLVHSLAADRLLYNIVALHLLLGLCLLVSVIIRTLIARGSARLRQMSPNAWVQEMSEQAARRARTGLFWGTLGFMGLLVVAGIIYQISGRNAYHDLNKVFSRYTWRHGIALGLIIGKLAALGLICWVAARQLRRRLPLLRQYLSAQLGGSREDALARWIGLLERYAVVLLALAAGWCAGQILGIVVFADRVLGFAFRVATVLSVSHLFILSSRTLSELLCAWGNRRFNAGRFRPYWERISRLLPFGERCFEAAVYVTAASLCVKEFRFIAVVAAYGPRLVECIGIFFGTRVVIDLLHALLNEAFGTYKETEGLDQKKLTLVPLLQSVSQYVLYFGCGVAMLDVLGIPTSPILAGAGIIGLAGGLGAQSLVTDVVSGFFILFENQYLVGDVVKLGDASGTVEAVSIRTTQVRDERGRLHIIPNGQIKSVVNYSKEFVIAQVDIKLPAERKLDDVFRAMSEAGRRLRASQNEVLGDTVIGGLVELGPSDMTVRATTRVRPGTHQAMEAVYRRMLKDVLDEQKAAPEQAVLALAA